MQMKGRAHISAFRRNACKASLQLACWWLSSQAVRSSCCQPAWKREQAALALPEPTRALHSGQTRLWLDTQRQMQSWQNSCCKLE